MGPRESRLKRKLGTVILVAINSVNVHIAKKIIIIVRDERHAKTITPWNSSESKCMLRSFDHEERIMLKLLDFRIKGPNAFVPLEYFNLRENPRDGDLGINLGLLRLNTCCAGARELGYQAVQR